MQTGVSLPSPVNEGLLGHSLTAALHSWLSPGHGAELTREEETRNVDSGFLQKSLLHRTEGILFVTTTVLRVTEGSSHVTDVCPHLLPGACSLEEHSDATSLLPGSPESRPWRRSLCVCDASKKL